MGWLEAHLDLIVVIVGGAFSLGALLWRGAENTAQIVGRLDILAHRLGSVEKSVAIASEARGLIHKKIDRLAEQHDGKITNVRERVVVLETKVG